MKGKSHIIVTFTIMSFFIFWIYNFLFEKINILIISFGVISVIVGSVLPDADIEDGKSKIFFWFLPIAIIVRMLEYPLAFILKKPAKHRGVLHTHIGASFSSLVVVIILSLILYFISEFSFMIVLYIYILTFMSQELHMLEDKFSDNLIYIIIIIVLIIISYFVMKPI